MIGQSDLSNWDHIFATSTKWFDAVITLRKLPAAREKIMKEKEIRKNLNRLEVPDWDLGHVLISQLEQSYGHLAMFFSQESSARLIGIKFKKQKVRSGLWIFRKFKNIFQYFLKCTFQEVKGLEGECLGGMAQSADGLYTNRTGLLNDFRILGQGIIDQITVQKE